MSHVINCLFLVHNVRHDTDVKIKIKLMIWSDNVLTDQKCLQIFYHFMAHGSYEPAHWYRQFDDTTDLKKLEEFIERLKQDEA